MKIQDTKEAWKRIRDRYPSLPVYTIGIYSGNPDATDILTYISGAGRFMETPNPDDLQQALNGILDAMSAKNLVITDTLSEYVTWYGMNPDLKVKRIEANGDTTVVWESTEGVSGDSGMVTVGVATAANHVTQSGQTIPVVQGATFTPLGDGTSGGTLQVQFNPALRMEPGVRYEVSFNVTVSSNAIIQRQSELAAGNDSYGGNVGDPNTDYAGSSVTTPNTTSSGQPGFPSNGSASATCTFNGTYIGLPPYAKPVVQVANEGYELPKTGGIGTSLFTWGGAALVVASLVCLIHARHKRGKEESWMPNR